MTAHEQQLDRAVDVVPHRAAPGLSCPGLAALPCRLRRASRDQPAGLCRGESVAQGSQNHHYRAEFGRPGQPARRAPPTAEP